ncbi:RES domain-containing protein [Thiomicrorhabdus sp. Milos-T2]|uniref:RES domain-containing protein n=1 Tax=Thiomicrorhabdus sp. Milos-T2 TaxID=90814 RepID=UPI00068B3ACC|nr:RES domain-containing protein [Thiomicrorhabdus sp. Milos-T2]
MLKPFEDIIINHKTSFGVGIESDCFVDLKGDKSICDKQDYNKSQRTGKQMREQGVQVFSYTSARCTHAEDIGVFDIDAIKSVKPDEMVEWEIKQTSDSILFFCSAYPDKSTEFSIEKFLVDGELPVPSN